MADLPSLLLESLDPKTRKQAEQKLYTISTQPGFLQHLLQLVLEPSQNRAVRLAGSVYLKNITKLRWEEVSCFWFRDLSRVDQTSAIHVGCTTAAKDRQGCAERSIDTSDDGVVGDRR
jgi:hypothetical protein